MNSIFKLIDRKKIISTIYTSCDLNEVIHEYLSLIDTELKLLKSYNVNIPKNDIKFDHLFIIEESNTHKPKKNP
jgi:alkyl hydroperoxide reductase subunit AhpC